MQVVFYEVTYQGARASNQDYFVHIITEKGCCFIVADGLGGHPGGEIASKVFCEALILNIQQYIDNIINDAVWGIEHLFDSAWIAMCQEIKSHHPDVQPHTTIALAWLDETQLVTAHVGDSRIYRLDSNEILWRTPDHTPVQDLFEQGLITEDDFSNHPLQNKLTKTINIYEPPEADIFLDAPLEANETLLLCSDGFWNALKQDEIITLGKTDNLQRSITHLAEKILAEHAKDADNITVQLVRLQ